MLQSIHRIYYGKQGLNIILKLKKKLCRKLLYTFHHQCYKNKASSFYN